MEQHGQSFPDALADAQRLGFAEANPTDDIEGFDVAYKISILASLAFGSFVDVTSVYRQGISQITDADIRIAREFGYRIKMIGFARRGAGCLDVRAHPMLVPLQHPLASVGGANNAIFISGNAVGELMLLGPGAGQMPTDFAPYFQPAIDSRESPLCSVEQNRNSFYVRLVTADVPGVIGKLGQALGEHNVSLHSLVQRGITADGSATIILLTHATLEADMFRALKEIEAQGTTREVAVALRVFD
jgi:homoserine dehydrogenase